MRRRVRWHDRRSGSFLDSALRLVRRSSALLRLRPWIGLSNESGRSRDGRKGIFSMIRGSAKAERKRAEETKRQRWNMFDCFCPISLDKSPRLFYAELDEWPIRNQPG